VHAGSSASALLYPGNKRPPHPLPGATISGVFAMGRGLLLWLIGIPLPIILLLWLFGFLS
jgi:hypothetical protein